MAAIEVAYSQAGKPLPTVAGCTFIILVVFIDYSSMAADVASVCAGLAEHTDASACASAWVDHAQRTVADDRWATTDSTASFRGSVVAFSVAEANSVATASCSIQLGHYTAL